MHLVGHVGHHHFLGLGHGSQPLGPIRQGTLRFIEPIELRQVKAGVVGLALVGAVAQRKKSVSIGLTCTPAHAPHHELAGATAFEVFRPLGRLELHAQAQGVHVLFPQFNELTALLVGLRGVLQHQGFAIGLLAPAIAVFVYIAMQVQQRLGAGQVVLAHLGLERGVVTKGLRTNGALPGNGLIAARQADLFFKIHRQRDGPPQRHFVRLIAAHQRVLHGEVTHRDIGPRVAHHAHASFLQIGGELVVRNGQVGELRWHVLQQVLFGIQIRQPPRLGLFDDGDDDPIHQGQALPLEARRHVLQPRLPFGRMLVVQHLAVIGVACQHHARAALPFGQHKGPRAHRVFANFVPVVLHHLPRQGAGERAVGEVVEKSGVGFGQTNAEGIPVQRLQALDLLVVIKRLFGRDELFAQLREPDDFGVLKDVEVGALPARVVVAFERVDIVGRRQLALLAFERRVVCKKDPRLDAKGKDLEVLRDLGHGLRRVGTHACG